MTLACIVSTGMQYRFDIKTTPMAGTELDIDRGILPDKAAAPRPAE